jgi:hypothetical protein
MKTRPLLTATAALLASMALAAAQTAAPDNKSQAAEPPPAAIKNALPDKIAPADNLKALAEPKALEKPPEKASETTGDATGQSNTLTAPPKPGVTADPIDQPAVKPPTKDGNTK